MQSLLLAEQRYTSPGRESSVAHDPIAAFVRGSKL